MNANPRRHQLVQQRAEQRAQRGVLATMELLLSLNKVELPDYLFLLREAGQREHNTLQRARIDIELSVGSANRATT